MKVWRCPVCINELRGPNRPKKDDIRKYCLTCSKEKQRLITRTPLPDRHYYHPRVKETKDNKKYLINNVDTRRLLKDLCLLPLWKSYFLKVGTPKFLMRRFKKRRYTTGRSCRDSNEFCLTVGVGCDIVNVESLMLHEISHLADPNKEHHSNYWKNLYCRSIKDRYGVDIIYKNLTIHELTEAVEDKIRFLMSNYQ